MQAKKRLPEVLFEGLSQGLGGPIAVVAGIRSGFENRGLAKQYLEKHPNTPEAVSQSQVDLSL